MEEVACGQALRGCEMSAGACLMGPQRVLARSRDGAAGLHAAGPGVVAGDQGLGFAPCGLTLPCEDRTEPPASLTPVRAGVRPRPGGLPASGSRGEAARQDRRGHVSRDTGSQSA